MRLRSFLLCAGLLLILNGSASAVGVAPPGTADGIRVSAQLLLETNHPVEADRQMGLVLAQIESAPEKANAYAERGRLCVLAQRFKFAEADFAEALKLDPNCRAAMTYRARIWLDNREYDRVIAALKHDDPGMTNGDEQAILALALLRRDGPGDKDEGIRLADQAWDLCYKDSSFDVEIATGEAGRARNLISGARSHFEKAATFAPTHPDVVTNLRIVDDFEAAAEGDRYEAVKNAFEKKEYSKAADYCRSILDRHPNDADGLDLLGSIYLAWADQLAETHEITRARQTLALARKTDVPAIVKQVDNREKSLREHMLAAQHAGNDTLALAIAEAQLSVVPEDVEARQIQITLYARENRWPELIQAYQDGLTHLAGNPHSDTYINQWGMGKGVALQQIERELTAQVENGTVNEKQLTALIDIFSAIAQSEYKSSYNYEVLSDLYSLHGDWQRASVTMWQAVGLADPSLKERLTQREEEADANRRRAPTSGPNAALFLRYHRRVDDLINGIRSGGVRPEDAALERALPPDIQSRLHELRSEIALLGFYKNQANEENQRAESAVGKVEEARKNSDQEMYDREYQKTRDAESRRDTAVQNFKNVEMRVNQRIERFWLD